MLDYNEKRVGFMKKTKQEFTEIYLKGDVEFINKIVKLAKKGLFERKCQIIDLCPKLKEIDEAD